MATLTSDWLRHFATSPLKPLSGFQRNLTGSKISTSSTKFVFFGPISKQKGPPWSITLKGGRLYSGARYVALWASCLLFFFLVVLLHFLFSSPELNAKRLLSLLIRASSVIRPSVCSSTSFVRHNPFYSFDFIFKWGADRVRGKGRLGTGRGVRGAGGG